MRLLCLLFITCFDVGAYARNMPIPRISRGYLVDLATASWHVGLYRQTASSYRQICGGTIIAKRVVVTAAHCVTEDRLVLPASQFAVAAGKIFRLWNDTRDVGAQKSDVSEIKVPLRYQGVVTNFQHDIALLLLTAEFTYTNHVKPACLNFDPDFDEKQLQEGQWGKVVGWGLTGKNSRPSKVLRGATLQYLAINKCIEQSPVGFRSLITGDKICAGYKNGTAVCRGDSGGGLLFPAEVDGFQRFFLRGVVSVSPTSAELCNVQTWATFTHLLQHEHFVKHGIFFFVSPIILDDHYKLVKILHGIVSTSPTSDNEWNIYTWATFIHLLKHEHFLKSILPDLVEESITSTKTVFNFRDKTQQEEHYKQESCNCVSPSKS